MAQARDCKSHQASKLWVFVHLTSANMPLAKDSLTAKPKVKGWGSLSCLCEAVAGVGVMTEWGIRTNNSIYHSHFLEQRKLDKDIVALQLVFNSIIWDAKYPYKVVGYQIANKRIIQHDQVAFIPGIQGQYSIKISINISHYGDNIFLWNLNHHLHTHLKVIQ